MGKSIEQPRCGCAATLKERAARLRRFLRTTIRKVPRPWHASILRWRCEPDAALAAIAKAPTWLLDNKSNALIPAMLLRGQALARKGETGPARAAFLAAQKALQELPRDQPGAQSNIADVYAGLGQTDAALAAARRATDLLPLSRDMVGGVFYLTRLAKIEAQVGETESALNHIEQLLAVPAGREMSAASLRTDPAWDSLRKDSRFQALLIAHPNDDKAAHP